MKWLYLFLAGALEITWAVAMKKSNGFTVVCKEKTWVSFFVSFGETESGEMPGMIYMFI